MKHINCQEFFKKKYGRAIVGTVISNNVLLL